MISIFATGFIVEQPELKYHGEKAILEFRVCDTRREYRDGEYHTVWESVTCVLFDKEAEKYAERLTKGRTVEVVGQQRTSTWGSGEGKRKAVKYHVDRIVLPYQAPREQTSQASEVTQTPQNSVSASQNRVQVANKSSPAQQYVNAEPVPHVRTSEGFKTRFAAPQSDVGNSPKVIY